MFLLAGTAAYDQVNTHSGHQNRSDECTGHQMDRLLQRSFVRRAWRSSPTATRNAQNIGADDLSAQKIRPRHDTHHWWLSIRQIVVCKLCTIFYKCLHSVVPPSLMEMCQPVYSFSGRSCLWSPAPRWSGWTANHDVNLPHSFAVLGQHYTSIVPWRNPDTRTISTHTENVAVAVSLAWYDSALVTVYKLLERRSIDVRTELNSENWQMFLIWHVYTVHFMIDNYTLFCTGKYNNLVFVYRNFITQVIT